MTKPKESTVDHEIEGFERQMAHIEAEGGP